MHKRAGDMVVVITGAASGIGLATAYAFAQRGAAVVVCGRQENALTQVAQDCKEMTGRALAVPADVTRDEDVQLVARRALENFGRIDLWVNNAAITAFGSFEQIPIDVFRRVIETNLMGYVNGMRTALPYMREQGSGMIVNVASMVSLAPQPYIAPYAASKAAVRALSECLRMELSLEGAEDIHVCTVLPQAIDTPLFQHGANFSGRAVQALPPVLPPEQVAKAIVRLAEQPQREVFVGHTARMAAGMRALAPQLFERIAARQVDRSHFQQWPAPKSLGNIFEPASDFPELRGGWERPSHSLRNLALASILLTVPLYLVWRGRQRGSSERLGWQG